MVEFVGKFAERIHLIILSISFRQGLVHNRLWTDLPGILETQFDDKILWKYIWTLMKLQNQI
jgi:hypothetical protein